MRFKRSFTEIFFATILGSFLILAVFHRSLFLFFAQDDFYLLARTKSVNIIQFLTLFLPQYDTVWYRPLSQYIFFWTGQQIFGLNPFLFHVVLLCTHSLNGGLIYGLLRKLHLRMETSLLGMLFYILNVSHFLSLSWPAAYGFVLGPTTFLLTLFALIKFMKNMNWKWFFLACVSYLVALLTIEFNVSLLLLYLSLVLFKRPRFHKAFLLLLAIFLFSFMFLALRFIFFPVEVSGAYQLTTNYVIKTFVYYALRFAGIAHGRHLVYSEVSLINIMVGLTMIVIGFLGPFFILRKRVIDNKTFRLAIIIILLGLLPFLILPFHKSPHYLSYALIGGSIGLSVLWDKLFGIFPFPITYRFFGVVAFLIIAQSLIGNEIEWQTHWIVRRANMAYNLISHDQYIAPVGTEEYFALGANYAAKVYDEHLYDPSL